MKKTFVIPFEKQDEVEYFVLNGLERIVAKWLNELLDANNANGVKRILITNKLIITTSRLADGSIRPGKADWYFIMQYNGNEWTKVRIIHQKRRNSNERKKEAC